MQYRFTRGWLKDFRRHNRHGRCSTCNLDPSRKASNKIPGQKKLAFQEFQRELKHYDS